MVSPLKVIINHGDSSYSFGSEGAYHDLFDFSLSLAINSKIDTVKMTLINYGGHWDNLIPSDELLVYIGGNLIFRGVIENIKKEKSSPGRNDIMVINASDETVIMHERIVIEQLKYVIVDDTVKYLLEKYSNIGTDYVEEV
jgi:hypothetical protein